MAADGLLRRRAPRRSGSSRSSHRPTRDRSPDRPRPRGLRLLFEASLCPGRLDRTVKSGFAGLLSWDSSVRPSIDLLPGPGQSGVATDPVPDRQVRDRCRPRGFAPPRRFFRPRKSRACCIPLPILGFAAFGAQMRSPRDAFRTPRRIPSPTAAPRHRGRCLSCGSPTTGRARLLAQPDRTGGPRRQMGSGPPIARRTSTHLRGSPGTGLTRCRRAPGSSGRRPIRTRPPLPDAAPIGRAAASGPCSADEFVPYRTGLATGDGKHGSSWASFPFKAFLRDPLRHPAPRERGAIGRGIPAGVRRPAACAA